MSIHAFREALVTFDYPAGRLRMTQGALDPASAGVIEIEVSERGPIAVPIRIGSTTLPAHIDTGSPGSITIPQRLLGELELLEEPVDAGPIRVVGASGNLFKSQLNGTVSVGAIRLKDPEIAITDLPFPAVNLGSGFLTDKVLILDLRHDLLALLPAGPKAHERGPSRTTAPPRSGRRSLGIHIGQQGPPGPHGLPLVDGGLEVGAVVPGSLAAGAGIRPGDFITRVNERPMKDLAMTALQELFGGSAPLRLEIRRDGASQVVMIGSP